MSKDKKAPGKSKLRKMLDGLGREVKSAKTSKFRCATTGKYDCEECGRPIERGENLHIVDVKYRDGMQDRFEFCSSKHRDAYCKAHEIPLRNR